MQAGTRAGRICCPIPTLVQARLGPCDGGGVSGRQLGRAMRIGTNHGSLSARTLSYYGDTTAGMVESAFEFARICRCGSSPASEP